jgi:glycosyltransferase involved in cell wall biosynthesis
VIIPCRDEAATLGEQLDALAGQAWDGSWEVLVVDNRSKDATAVIASEHPGLAGRLRVVDASGADGVAYARRRGVEESRAAAVVFCDGDDVVARGWLAAMGDALRTHELVTGEIDLDELNEPDLAGTRGRRPPGAPPVFAGTVFLRGNNGGMSRAAWDELGGFDETFIGLEDIELSLRAAARGMLVHFTSAAVVHYRYRTSWPALWRQGRFYGESVPRLAVRCRQLGLSPPSRLAGWRSWAWLAVHLPLLPSRRVRYRWVWTLASRLGVLRAAVQCRTIQV